MNRYTPTMIWLALCLIVVLVNMSCTNTPSGAVEFNTTRYYIDGKFHEEIPEPLRKQGISKICAVIARLFFRFPFSPLFFVFSFLLLIH